jgi:GR25 family glycosyltransferase involved in LPS biosynthesis
MNLQEILAEFVCGPPGNIGVGVIHLARATEREPVIRALEAALGQPLERFEAVDGAANHPRTYMRNPAVDRTVGEIGCLLSHVAVARRGLAEGWSHALIFEDDCAAAETFSLAALQDFLRRAKVFSVQFGFKGAEDFILLGNCGCYTWKFLAGGVKATDSFNGTHSYLIGRPMMEKLVSAYEHLLKSGGVVPADELFSLLLKTQRRWVLCPEDERGLFLQNRSLPSHTVGGIRNE